jgi:hypothetical protein
MNNGVIYINIKIYMTKHLIVSLLLLHIITIPSGIEAQSWIRFKPDGQPFEVYVPGEMKNGEKKILTKVGELHPITWLYQAKADESNYLYSVSYVDYPEGTFHSDSTELIQELFKVSIETHISDLNGKLIYESESPYLSYPGILYRASYNNNKAVVKSRMILSGDRFYALQVYTLSEKSLNPDMDKFLDSFKITNSLKKH